MANDVNVVILNGRLTKDCEFKSLPNGNSVVRFSIAVNRRIKSGEQWTDEANFFNIVLFGKMAESLKPYLTKGQQVSIQGELRQNTWEKDSKKYSAVEVMIPMGGKCQLMGGPKANSGNIMQKTSVPDNAVPAPAPGNEPPAEDYLSDADIPF